eukprot:TRINITY_DN16901_c0_g1_i1.p1 TRINITY_DN16901_c0_g1~~TRINITY_DN16901_c0_g1_i1.p1  ORF type:complete len:680 (-),score=160.38 TRINITY_DN16901_c0_g1_i1:33-2072(-)
MSLAVTLDVPTEPFSMSAEISSMSSGEVSPMFSLDVERIKSCVRENIEKNKKTYSVTDFYHKKGLWQKIARSPIFENFTLSVIFINACWMSYDTDMNDASTLLEADPQFQLLDQFFCIYFSFEWFVRYMAFERKCNGLKDAWFVFDSALVFLMVAETWVLTCILWGLGSGSGGNALGNAAILRLLRLLRLSRLMRMLRSLPELMIMIKGILKAFPSVFFTLVLLVVCMYVFSIAFTQLAANTPLGEPDGLFPNIFATMYLLLITGTFLDNLSFILTRCLVDGGMHFFILFIVFILLAALTVMNMLIGVLCEVVSGVAEIENEEMTLAFIRSKMKKIVDEIDEDGDRMISKKEFAMILEKPEAVLALQEVDVDPLALVEMSEYIFSEEEGTEELDLADFMEAILQLRGVNTATVKDLVDLRRWILSKFLLLEDRLTGLKPLRRGSHLDVASATPVVATTAVQRMTLSGSGSGVPFSQQACESSRESCSFGAPPRMPSPPLPAVPAPVLAPVLAPMPMPAIVEAVQSAAGGVEAFLMAAAAEASQPATQRSSRRAARLRGFAESALREGDRLRLLLPYEFGDEKPVAGIGIGGCSKPLVATALALDIHLELARLERLVLARLPAHDEELQNDSRCCSPSPGTSELRRAAAVCEDSTGDLMPMLFERLEAWRALRERLPMQP